jgi:hypothetical protein
MRREKATSMSPPVHYAKPNAAVSHRFPNRNPQASEVRMGMYNEEATIRDGWQRTMAVERR